ncbi:hypothetical protein HMI56_000381, partial [Coelomomyces lativittatus]
ADPKACPLDVFRLYIVQHLHAHTSDLTADYLYSVIEETKKFISADLSVPVQKLKLKGNPVDIAKKISEKFEANEYIVESFPSGPYINYILNTPMLYRLVFKQVSSQLEMYGTNTSGHGKKALVEFSSPNIAKPFHAGHLRSTIIGNFIRNILKGNGWDTIAMNYLGDWGKQYGLLAVGFQKYGNEEKLALDPIQHLFEVYVSINKDAEQDPSLHDEARAYFKKMETGDAEALTLWQRFRDLSIEKYKLMYKRLGVEFDEYSGESQVSKEMSEVNTLLREKKLLEQSEGAWVVNLKEDNLGMAIIEKKDGATLYLTRDAGAAKGRHERFQFDEMYYIVGTPQEFHFKQLFCILKKLDFSFASHCHHISFGSVAGMSTRKGNVVFLQEILDHAKERVLEIMQVNTEKYAQIENPEAVADLIGISAIAIQDMSSRRIKGYSFDWKRMFNFEGDSGPYLQYAHARLSSIQRKIQLSASTPLNLDLLSEPEIRPLMMLIAKFPDIIRDAPKTNFEPCHLVSYLFQLCHTVSSMLQNLYVVNQEPELQKARLLLYASTRITLGNGLRFLGLRPLEKM